VKNLRQFYKRKMKRWRRRRSSHQRGGVLVNSMRKRDYQRKVARSERSGRSGKPHNSRRGWSRQVLRAAHKAYVVTDKAIRYWKPNHPWWERSDARAGARAAWIATYTPQARERTLAGVKTKIGRAYNAGKEAGEKTRQLIASTGVRKEHLAVAVVAPVVYATVAPQIIAAGAIGYFEQWRRFHEDMSDEQYEAYLERRNGDRRRRVRAYVEKQLRH
jgi:hypothetical protein